MTAQSHSRKAQRAADRQAVADIDNPPVVRPRQTLALAGAAATTGPELAVPLDDRRCCTSCGRAPDAAAWLAEHLRRHPGQPLSAVAAAGACVGLSGAAVNAAATELGCSRSATGNPRTVRLAMPLLVRSDLLRGVSVARIGHGAVAHAVNGGAR